MIAPSMFPVKPGVAAAVIATAAAGMAVIPRTQVGAPVAFPPTRLGFGNISWKATVIVKEADKEVAKVIGYSQSVTIARETQNACRLHKPRTAKCGEPELVMLSRPGGDTGIFWVSNSGSVRQLS